MATTPGSCAGTTRLRRSWQARVSSFRAKYSLSRRLARRGFNKTLLAALRLFGMLTMEHFVYFVVFAGIALISFVIALCFD
jgi:hypothetical protein